jgi:hypothetical protein
MPQVLMTLLHCTQDALLANNYHKKLWIRSFKLFSRKQDQMRHHGKFVHKPSYDPWSELHNITLLLPLIKIMA